MKTSKHIKKAKNILSANRNRGYKISIALIVLILGFSTYSILSRPNYTISLSAQKLIGKPDLALAKAGLTFSKKDQSYTLNKKLIGNKSYNNTVRVGGGNTATYSFNAPLNINKTEVKFYDDRNNISFGLKPNFKTAVGKYSSGMFVYPINHSEQAVYSIKANGLKEDIIVNKPIGNNAVLGYTLNLPASLEARIMPTGDIGVYSASPVLFGNVSAATSSDQSLLKNARSNGAKNYLEFVLAAPTVKSLNGNIGKANFKLNGTQLSINVSGLKNASYPFTIDPSVVVTSANAFSGGNVDSNINVGASAIQTNYITGGYIGAWAHPATPTIANASDGIASAVYNGNVYIAGGVNGSTYYNTIQCASLSSGTIGSWTTSGFTVPVNLAFASMVTYNGYLYIVGGQTSSSAYVSTTYYAPISSSGCISSAPVATTNTFVTARSDSAAVAYNGYLYIVGGLTSASATGCTTGATSTWYCSDIQYARFSANGNITTSWTSSGVSFTAAEGVSSIAYNNNLYVMGGYNGSDVSTVGYIPINSDGSLNGSSPGSTSGLLTAGSNFGSTVYDGYVYAYGGLTGVPLTSHAPMGSNLTTYAQINANGSLATWSKTTDNATATVSDSANFAYNGYLYQVGGIHNSNADTVCGSSGTFYCTKSFSSAISSAGYTNGTTFTASGNSIPTGLYMPAVTIYENHIFVMGGCFQNSATKTCNASAGETTTIYYATISSSGVIGTFSTSASVLPRAVFGATAIGYNGSIYVFGGCSTTGSFNYIACNTSFGGVVYLALNSSATGTTDPVNTVANQTANGHNQFGASAVEYGNYIFLIGGCNSVSVNLANAYCGNASTNFAETTCEYWEFTNNSAGAFNSGAFASNGTCTSLPVGLYGMGATVYNGYVYLAGGCNGYIGATNTNPCGSTWSSSGNTVYYISVANLENNTGSWSSISGGSSFSTSRAWNGAYAYNGYLYVYGGCATFGTSFSGCSSLLRDLQYAPINPSTGAPGSFTTINSNAMVAANWGFGTAAYNGYIVTAGGCTAVSDASNAACGAFSTTVQEIQLNTAGTSLVGTWATNSTAYSGTAARSYASTVKYTTGNNTYMYVVGGKKASSSTTCLNTGSASFDCNDILMYKLAIDGTQTLVGTYYFATARYDAEVAAYNGYLYIFGGQSTASNTNCLANLYFGSSGLAQNSNSPFGFQNNSTVNACQDVQVAKITSSTGVLTNPSFGTSNAGASDQTSTVPNPIQPVANNNNAYLGNHAVVYGGYLYVNDSGLFGNYFDQIASIKINSDGSLASSATSNVTKVWTTSSASGSSYSIGFWGNGNGDMGDELTEYNGYLYIGNSFSTTTTSTIVWTFGTTKFPNTSKDLITTIKLGPNGTLGSATTLSTDAELSWPMGFSLIGYLYLIGGDPNATTGYGYTAGAANQSCNNTATTTGPDCNFIWSAPIQPNGTIGAFTYAGNLNTTISNGELQQVSAVVHNGYLILTGGNPNSFSSPDSNISSAPLNISPHTGLYSYLANIGRDVTPASISLVGANTNADSFNQYTNQGNINFSYSFALNSSDPICTTTALNTPSILNNILISSAYATPMTTEPCTSTSQTLAKYEYVTVQIDDSGVFTFPDNAAALGTTSTNHTSLTGMTMYYHTNTGNRLRLGQTFINNAATSLDASPVN